MKIGKEKSLISCCCNDIFVPSQKDLNNYGELVFGDLAVMYPYDGFNYFLLVVDGFSSKVFVRPLKSKKSSLVAKALDDIFSEFNAQIYVFETGVYNNNCKTKLIAGHYTSKIETTISL